MVDKEVLAALKRIEAIAHYYGSIAGQSDEITQAFKGIVDEASEAIAMMKEQTSDEMLTAMQAWLKKRDMTPEQAFGSSEFIREAYRLFEEQTNG